jgi:hypothetical protein
VRVVLVEGESDRAALLALAPRLDVDLAALDVRAIGGAGNFPVTIAREPAARGLYDANEERDVVRGLAALGRTGPPAEHGFHRCDPDLEAELIAAVGIAGVLDVLEADGQADRFRTFQKQPFHRERPVAAQLRRFLGTTSGRKIRYGRLLGEAVDLDAVPAPLRAVLSP